MSVIVFTEEYEKSTKGTFNVLVNFVSETSKINKITILINFHHWGCEELKSIFFENKNVEIKYLPIILPSKLYLFFLKKKPNFLRKITYVIGFIFDTILMPLFITWLIYFLKIKSVNTIFSHNGGWPGSKLCSWIIIASYFAKIKNRIFIVHSHPVVSRKKFLLFTEIAKKIKIFLIEKTVSNIVTVSGSVKNELKNIFPNSKIVKIHNGISEKLISVNKKDKFVFDKKLNYVGFIGEISCNKGVHVLIEAANNILQNTKVVLLGPYNSIDIGNLKKQAKLLKNKIIFYGYSDNIKTFLKKIDILVVPAIAYESFSIVVLEAMSQKKPVICSDFGGMKEIVIHGKTGLIFESNNPKKLSVAINKLVINKKLKKQMGIAGYYRYKKYFSAKKMCENYSKLLK